MKFNEGTPKITTTPIATKERRSSTWIGRIGGNQQEVKSMKNFQPHEFACSDGCGGGYSDMDSALLYGLDEARTIAGIPFSLTSAFRCENHNKAVGGVPDSSHTTGNAVDILARSGREKWIIVNALVACGFNRIGIAGTFIHVDNDSTKTPRVIWGY